MPHPLPAPRRPLNPFLRRHIERSGKSQIALSVVGGFTHRTTMYALLHAERVPATPQTIQRLERLAQATGFPVDEIFLDGVAR